MRKNFGAKPMVYPMPVFIIGSYGEGDVPNAMNAAWGGISEEDEISICISPEHKTTKNILARGAFTVSPATEDSVCASDYVGIVSGNDVEDKLSLCGFTVEKSEFVDAPVICQLPMTLECRLKSYDDKSCRLVGEIVNVSCEESVLTDGRIDPEKLRPISYDPSLHGYYALGKKVGKAFFDGKKIGK